MKKILVVLLSFTLILCMGFESIVYAGPISDKKDELAEVQEQQNEVSGNLDDLAEKIEAQKAIVAELEGNIAEKQSEIDQTESEVTAIKKNIITQRKGLNKRLRAMYKSGSVGYLDVLFGSNSLSEFLDNLSMVQKIYKADQDTLATLKKQEDDLNSKQQQLKEEKAELAGQVEDAEAKQAALNEDISALQIKLEELNQQAEDINGEIKRLQEENRKRKEEEARRKAEQEAANQQDTPEPAPVPDYSGSGFIWPTTSYTITSEFGYRIHPITGIYTGHTGIDIGVAYNSPVYASASGTVIVAGWYGGYGYAVVIDHGGGVSTLYGHNNSLNVSVGDEVSQGEVVALSGSTGNSTGPHLHFEIRIDGACVDPMAYF